MNRYRLTFILIAATLFLQTDFLSAQLRGFAFLRTTFGGRAGGMGGAYTAMTGDLHAIGSNPALIAGLKKRQGAFDYVNHVLDIQSGFGAYLHPLRNGNLAIALFFQDYGDLQRIDEFGNEQGSFSASSFALAASYSRKIQPSVWVGGTLKYFRSAIDAYSADGFAVDAGVFWQTSLFDNLKVGAAVANLGRARTAFIETRESLPTRVEVGVSKRLAHLPLEWALTLQKYPDEDLIFAAGGEFTLSPHLFLRLGYNSLAKDQKVGLSNERFAGISTGFGIRYQKYLIDYSFTSMGAVGSQNRLSLSVTF